LLALGACGFGFGFRHGATENGKSKMEKGGA